MPWDHLTPIHGHPMEADVDCSGLQYAAKFIVAGDFDKDGLTEVVVAPDATGSRGNDLWVMKFNVTSQLWDHLSPIINHPMQADVDCSGLQYPAKSAIVGDFDGDEADELVVVPDAGGSKGNDFWVMKFDPASSTWRHMVPIPNHPMEADIDCSGLKFPAKLVIAGNFDGDDRDELVVLPDAPGSRGNDLWVMKYFGIFAPPQWVHMAPIPNHPMEADVDCSSVQYPIKSILVADFDGDQRDELVAVPAADGSRGNDLWVMKYVGDFPQGQWQHMAPIPNHPMDADIDCSGRPYPAKLVIAADFDADGRAELVVVPDAPGSRGNDLWVMKYVGDFPQGQWQHMAPIPNHPMDADIDCSGRPYPAKFAITADLDGDDRAELVVVPDAPGSRGNDLWVMKYVGDFPQGQWQHMAPIPNHPMDADIDCSGLKYRAKMAAVGDFDRDGRDELVIAPDAASSRGNDLWVMKYFGDFPNGTFDHMSPIPNHQMEADIDCSSTKYPAKTMLVGNFDGVSPAILVAPKADGSRGNDFWVLEFSEQKIKLVNMIPNSLSGEVGQDSEPNLTVNPANPSQMVGSAFTSNPSGAGASTAPIFVSQDGGTTWFLNNIVPSQGSTFDITVRFATASNNLYAGILRNPGNFQRDILRTNNYLGPANMTQLVTRNPVDQPYVQAASVTGVTGAIADRVYVGNNDLGLFNRPMTGRTAIVEVSQDATLAPPSGFSSAGIEQGVNNGQDGPPVRPAVHPDGTVYAAFYRWTTINGNFMPAATITADLIVVRDDNWGAGATPFQALLDPTDNIAGRRVVTGRTVPFNNVSQPNFGQERFVASNLSIVIDPRDSRVVYIAWADRVGTDDYTLHVRLSTDGGATWSDDLRTITNATNPALAVNSAGKVAFLYQALTGDGVNQRWETHVELTTDDWRTPPSDVLLATVPADTPIAGPIPYLGDYVHILALGPTFFGIFSANNQPDNANFPNGVTYQRNADFGTNTLLNLDNVTPVPVSIDPFFFSISPA